MGKVVKIFNQKAEIVGQLDLTDSVFGLKPNIPLVHQAMVAQTSNNRQVLAHTKDRSEVRGGGKKPWRQKGTGRARSGSSRSPIWIGGGVTFGPTSDRNFKKDINKKMKQKALCIVLSDRLASEHMAVIDNIELAEFKTKIFNNIIKEFEKSVFKTTVLKEKSKKEKTKKVKRSILIVNDKKDEKAKYSGRNLAGVKMINLDNINIVDLLSSRYLLITAEAIKKLEERYK